MPSDEPNTKPSDAVASETSAANDTDEDIDGIDGGAEGDGSLLDGRAAARRGASESGPLFADRYRPGESRLDAGLIAGGRENPVLVAGVGYPLLGDLALGTVVAYRVAEWNLPGVAVADCSHTPVAAYQTISDGDHDTVILVGTEKRGGELNDGTPSETPGAIHERNVTDYEVPEEEAIARIGESAMGSNTVENVLVVSTVLGTLPADTRIITVEPGYDSWGTNVDEFTDPVTEALDEVLDRVLDALEATLA